MAQESEICPCCHCRFFRAHPDIRAMFERYEMEVTEPIDLTIHRPPIGGFRFTPIRILDRRRISISPRRFGYYAAGQKIAESDAGIVENGSRRLRVARTVMETGKVAHHIVGKAVHKLLGIAAGQRHAEQHSADGHFQRQYTALKKIAVLFCCVIFGWVLAHYFLLSWRGL